MSDVEAQTCRKCHGAKVVGKKRWTCPRCLGRGTWVPPAEETADLDEANAPAAMEEGAKAWRAGK